MNELYEALKQATNILQQNKVPQPLYAMFSPKFISKLLEDDNKLKEFIDECLRKQVVEIWSVNNKGVIIAKYKIKDGELELI